MDLLKTLHGSLGKGPVDPILETLFYIIFLFFSIISLRLFFAVLSLGFFVFTNLYVNELLSELAVTKAPRPLGWNLFIIHFSISLSTLSISFLTKLLNYTTIEIINILT